jgi:hypothetical protein
MKNIKSHLVEVEQINVQRIVWLTASILIYSAIIIITIILGFHSNNYISTTLWIIGAGIIGIWWLWSMHIINTLLAHRRIEFYILQDIIIDLRETKKLTKELFDHSAEL